MAEAEDANKVEAVLFTTGKFMTVDAIAKAAGIGSTGYIKQLLQHLQHKYQNENSALALFEHEDTYKLNVKKTYAELANTLMTGTEFDNPTTKTLAIIAYKNPALQSDIIKIRGTNAYDHIKRLHEAELITSEKKGRTRLLKITPKFYDYFDTAEETIKQEFTKIHHTLQNQQQPNQQQTNTATPPA